MAVSNIPFGVSRCSNRFFSPHTDRAASGNTHVAQLLLHEDGRYGALRAASWAFTHFAGRAQCRAGTSRARMADEAVRCRVGRALSEQPLLRPCRNRGRQRLIILQKKAAAGELTPRQLDFIESRKLSNGIRVNNLFRTFDRVIHTDAKVGTDPYGKPAMEFTHAGGASAIADELRRMLSDDLRANFDISYYLSHAPADDECAATICAATSRNGAQAGSWKPSTTSASRTRSEKTWPSSGRGQRKKERQIWKPPAATRRLRYCRRLRSLHDNRRRRSLFHAYRAAARKPSHRRSRC